MAKRKETYNKKSRAAVAKRVAANRYVGRRAIRKFTKPTSLIAGLTVFQVMDYLCAKVGKQEGYAAKQR